MTASSDSRASEAGATKEPVLYRVLLNGLYEAVNGESPDAVERDVSAGLGYAGLPLFCVAVKAVVAPPESGAESEAA